MRNNAVPSMSCRVRPACPADAAAIAGMANALHREMGMAGKPFSAAIVRRDGFGPDAAFAALIAEDDTGLPIGYALYTRCYNTDLAARGLWLDDIYVLPERRGAAVGRALMAAVAAAAVQAGCASVWWPVLSSNRRARRFYAGLGARDGGARVLELDGGPLRRLAGEAAR